MGFLFSRRGYLLRVPLKVLEGGFGGFLFWGSFKGFTGSFKGFTVLRVPARDPLRVLEGV